MSKWKTYIVDDFTPFHGMKQLAYEGMDSDEIFISELKDYEVALIITDGKSVDVWRRRRVEDILVHSTEKLSDTNLQKHFKITYNYSGAKELYKKYFNIDISEPTVYKHRKITI